MIRAFYRHEKAAEPAPKHRRYDTPRRCPRCKRLLFISDGDESNRLEILCKCGKKSVW